MRVALLSPAEFRAAMPRLGEILADAVVGGAGVSFMLPFSAAEGAAWWAGVDPAKKQVFAASQDGQIAGVVILERAWQPNQPHRGEISKLLVHRSFRRKGIGKLLLQAVEREARAQGLTLLNFDTVAGSPAEAFYRSLGFTCAGTIPGYAYSPDGRLDDTAIFYKQL
ncbi:MAG: GNAT family N-acetyltransferase [Rhizobiales bacterium]|nr:GNAT family N-acetyltransferase [Hyphomicrobiales bacterium]